MEQKNWTHVRVLFGYSRFSKKTHIQMMNEIYKNLWNPLWNYFTPVMKLESKERVGGGIHGSQQSSNPISETYRLWDINDGRNRNLKNTYEGLNPFELKKELEKQLKWFFRITEAGKQEAA